jgi:hypothetical protein
VVQQLINLYEGNELVVTAIAIGGGLLIALLRLMAAWLGRTQTVIHRNESDYWAVGQARSGIRLARSVKTIANVAAVILVAVTCMVAYRVLTQNGPNPSMPRQIIPGQVHQGVLSHKDSVGFDGAYLDRYALDVTRGARYEITMRSSDFPVSIGLENRDGPIRDATRRVVTPGVVEISIVAPVDETLIVLATASHPSAVGRYQIEAAELRR